MHTATSTTDISPGAHGRASAPGSESAESDLTRPMSSLERDTQDSTDAQSDDLPEEIEELEGVGTRALWNPDYLEAMYVDGEMTSEEIGDHVGCSGNAVLRHLKKHGFEIRSAGSRRGVQYSNTPSFHTNERGYEIASAYNLSDGGVENVLIHRLVAVAEYGFDAVVNKHVHHGNGVKYDNRPSNLEPLTPSEHMSLHARERWGTEGDSE